MRASTKVGDDRCHLSGAERLVSSPIVDTVVSDMLGRAQGKDPDMIQITAEAVDPETCKHIPCLPIRTVVTANHDEAIEIATGLLIHEGVSARVVVDAFEALKSGLGERGGAIRGASVWNMNTGERLERDRSRGVRATKFDYSADGEPSINEALLAHGLSHFRTKEALALATKAAWAGVTAELCWSDDADYTTGYVASPRIGYIRLPGFKAPNSVGGRVFFVRQGEKHVDSLENRLQNEPVLIETPISIFDSVTGGEFVEHWK